MSDPIIVAFNGDHGGRDALALATVLAKADPSELTPVIVANAYRYTPVGKSDREVAYEKMLRELAEEHLEPARKSHGDQPNTRFAAVSGSSAADALHRLAQAEHAAAIVIGGSSSGALGRMLPGSVTEQVLHGSPCAVVIAPADYATSPQRMETVGVAYDASTESLRAVEVASDLARRFGARLRIVRVIDEQVIRYAGFAGETALEELRDHARRELHDVCVAVTGVADVDSTLLEGSVPVQLARASAGFDLLVVGSRNNGPIKRVLLGSVSSRLAREAVCPLVAIPRSAAVDPLGETAVG